MLEVTAEWEGLDEAFAELERECAEVVRGISVRYWNYVLSQTPQAWGRMAASWTYSLNDGGQFYDRSSEVSFEGPRRQITGKLAPSYFLYKGHHAAIRIANSHSKGRESAFKLGDTIWFSNGVNHGEGPYSQAVENGEVRLRRVNQPGAPVRRGLDYIEAHFGRDVSKEAAQRLRTMRIGDGDAI